MVFIIFTDTLGFKMHKGNNRKDFYFITEEQSVFEN
jgi:hypothetical protein